MRSRYAGAPWSYLAKYSFRTSKALPKVPLPTASIKPGYLADMILVDGNPVANVKILQDATKLLAIMKDGQFHKEPHTASQSQRQIA
ncbi:MAG: hypothetical protein AABM64_03055 [Pseudomonadota bacterium]